MTRDRINFFFLNLGYFYDHLFVLIFATVAALALATEWGMSYEYRAILDPANYSPTAVSSI